MGSGVSREVKQFWQDFLAGLGAGPLPAEFDAWAFGASRESADELSALVRDGTKTATCGLLWEYEHDGDSLPQAGEHSVILNGSGQPVCVIETLEVAIRPFRGVDEAFAHAEGEGDRTLAGWREGHWEFFEQICERIDRLPEEDMILVCETFRVVYAPA